MEEKEIEKRIIELVENISDENVEITADRDLKDFGFDSLDKVELIMEVEKEFDIIIPDDKTDDVNTVEDLVKIVEEYT